MLMKRAALARALLFMPAAEQKNIHSFKERDREKAKTRISQQQFRSQLVSITRQVVIF